MMLKVLPVLLFFTLAGCTDPKLILGYQLPVNIVDHKPKNKHEISLETVKQWVLEGKYSGYAITHQGPSMFYFRNGITICIYHDTPKEVAIKFQEILKMNPKSNLVGGIIE